tara:strand:+ start:593 stop:1318 length:726 start_codon:yes stop_codon:yes gene_type:complete
MKDRINKTSSKYGQGIGRPTPSQQKAKIARRYPNRFSGFDVGLARKGQSSTSITSTGSQTYTVPAGVDSLTITMYGGGAGGGLARAGRGGTTKGGGGGGGARLVITLDEVTPGETLTFNVGAGGAKSVNNNSLSTSGGDTTFSYGGKDYVAGGGERNRSGGLSIGTSADGTGGAGDCDGGSTCTATAGNDGTAYNTGDSTTPGGNSLETGDSSGAGAGGTGSNNDSIQNAADGQNGKVVIS